MTRLRAAGEKKSHHSIFSVVFLFIVLFVFCATVRIEDLCRSLIS